MDLCHLFSYRSFEISKSTYIWYKEYWEETVNKFCYWTMYPDKFTSQQKSRIIDIRVQWMWLPRSAIYHRSCDSLGGGLRTVIIGMFPFSTAAPHSFLIHAPHTVLDNIYQLWAIAANFCFLFVIHADVECIKLFQIATQHQLLPYWL